MGRVVIMELRVGEVAAETGLSVRALHYYDQLGLVSPPIRTAGGRRLYSHDDVRRLCAVALLRLAGMPATEIGGHLAAPDWNISRIIEDQLTQLDAQLTALGTLRQRLAELVSINTSDESALLLRAQQTIAFPYGARKAVALLPYRDVAAAQEWLTDVFGLPPGPSWPRPDGAIRFASVATGQGLVHLHEATDVLEPPSATGSCTAMLVVTVDDVDRIAARIGSKGGRITHGPIDMPYGGSRGRRS